MTDRLPQYPIVSQFNPNMLHHHQQVSQSQQQPPVDTQAPSFPNQDLGRTWLQQNTYNSQSTEMQGPQMRERMAELLRHRQPQMGQQFGQQMGGNPQQSPFQDPSATQHTQSHMQTKFPNMGVPNSAQMQSLNSRNPLIQAFSGSNSVHLSRMDLMGMASGQQQTPNAQLNFAARMPQAIPQPQPSQASVNLQVTQSQAQQGEPFPSPAITPAEGIRRSPSHPLHPSAVVGNQPLNPVAIPAGRRPMNFQELRERAQQLQLHISQRETLLGQLSSHRAAMPEAEYIGQFRTLATDIKNCKETLNKVIHAMNHTAPQQLYPATGPNMDGNIQQQQQSTQQQSSALLVGTNQSQWSLPSGSQQPQPQLSGFGAQTGQATNLQSTSSLSIQPSPSQLHTQPAHSQPQNVIPPRRGPTPQLQPGQLPPQVTPSPNAPHQYPYQIPANGNGHRSDQLPHIQWKTGLMGFEREAFNKSYRTFCASRNLKHDRRLLSIESRPIDLHMLHQFVIAEGGFAKVNQQDLWAVIGARMGFVQFPASKTEFAKSGPGVAQHLNHVYKEYLFEFETAYIQSYIERRKMQIAGVAAAFGMPPTARAIPNAQEMQTIITHAHAPANELRAKGVSESMINFIEENREQLQQSAEMQSSWRGNLLGVKSSPGQPGTSQEQPQDTIHPGNSAPFTPQQTPNVHNTLQQPPVPRPGAFMQQQQPTPPASLVGGHNSEAQYPQPPQAIPMNGLNQHLPARVKSVPQEQWLSATIFITKARQDFMTRNIPNMALKVVPDNIKLEYNRVFERLQRSVMELEPRLPLFCLLMKGEDTLRRVIAIISTVQHQRNLLNSPTPKYIIDFSTLQSLVVQMQQSTEDFQAALNTVVKQQLNTTPASATQPGPLNLQHPSRPPIPQPPPPVSVPQLIPPQQTRTTPTTPVQVSKKKPLPGRAVPSSTSTGLAPTPLPVAASTPTSSPGPAATTPVASAHTPTHSVSSPQGSKSPKTKSTPKPKAASPAKRKASKSIPAPEAPPAAPVSAKRRREEETSVTASFTAQAADSPPKRVKTEVEVSMPESETLIKTREEVNNIKSEEDATAFLEQWFTADGQANDIVATLATLLQGCPDVPGSETSSNDGPSTSSLLSAPPQSAPGLAEQFMDYFDFSSFGTLADDVNTSKPPTPELVPSSSTNPSPESGSEADATGHAVNTDPRPHDIIDSSDFLRLGSWKEIDGGESAYYQPSEWRWDSPMPSLDQPWAIFTS